MLAVSWVNSQIVWDGLVQGLAIALIAVGVVLVYRATRIINFAVGNMGVIGAALLALLVVQYHVPFWVALVISLIAGLVFGAVIEMTVIRRLRNAPRVVVLVATIGIGGVAQVIAFKIPQPSDASAHYPAAFGLSTWTIAGVNVRGADLAVLVLVPVAVVALIWFLDHTMIGKTVKASAANPSLARLSSISPKLVSTMVWSLAAVLSTLSVILFAGESSTAAGLSNLGPETLAYGLAAAVIAGLRSFRVAVLASVVIAIVQSVLSYNFLATPGITDLLLFIAVFVAVIFAKREGEDSGVFAFSPRTRPIPARLRSVWWARNIDKGGILLLGAIAVVLPLIKSEPSSQQLFTAVLGFAICASSLTILTGWLGQLSLGQMAFAGLAALFAARLVTDGVPFWFAVLATAAASGLLALGVGIGSLRVRGLYLAVVTFVLALTAEQYFYYLPFFSGESPDGANVPFVPGKLGFLNFPGQKTYYYVVLVVLALVVLMLSRLRDSGAGRTIRALRDNEVAATAYGVRPVRLKLQTFAVSGGLAGLGGALLAGAYANIAFTQDFFLVNDSLNLVAMVVIGGMGSVSGAIIGAVVVIGIPALAPNNALVGLLSSSLGLLIVLLYFPRGLNQLTSGVRDAILSWADKRVGEQPMAERPKAAEVVRKHRAADVDFAASGPVLEVSDLRVRFGGLLAVDGVSLNVRSGEIVGLIGANGAGKSTLMNAIGGFVPSTGSVTLLGNEVSGKPPGYRATLGLGRTFQSATLFPELTVTETLLVAVEAKAVSSLLPSAFGLPKARRHSKAAKAEVSELVDFLGLGRYQDHYISDLSTGTRRIVELAGLLALDAKVLCLDEPTAGLAQRETEAFGPLIVAIREELSASVLLIEHDMPLIMGMSGRVYCLETGRIIAEGTPHELREDPKVIASYLGTDERAIARSGDAASMPLDQGPISTPVPEEQLTEVPGANPHAPTG
ncbi:MAG TPA: ATP-binding cassette domain-containing protein [Acidimicrobiales bacterium]|nr:ATP-binding cassette domain-containing protein [Acidimicrobiales bacterium]